MPNPISSSEARFDVAFRKYLKKEHPKVEYIDVIQNSKMCGNGTCLAWSEEIGPVHIDPRGHMTCKGAEAATPPDLFL